jgi:hypothetical protein
LWGKGFGKRPGVTSSNVERIGARYHLTNQKKLKVQGWRQILSVAVMRCCTAAAQKHKAKKSMKRVVS